jgi:hypothetical protein
MGTVTETVIFSQEEYDDFTSDFSVDRDFLSRKGGACEIIAPERETLFEKQRFQAAFC